MRICKLPNVNQIAHDAFFLPVCFVHSLAINELGSYVLSSLVLDLCLCRPSANCRSVPERATCMRGHQRRMVQHHAKSPGCQEQCT